MIEVADSTIAKERKQKASIYAKNQVLEYWSFDLQGRQVYVFRQPEAETYFLPSQILDALFPKAFP